MTTFVAGDGNDVYVEADDISFDPAEPYVGDLIDISVVVRNNGSTANNVGIGFYLDAELIGSDFKPVVPVSAMASDIWNTSGLAPGDYVIRVNVSASGDGNLTNNEANKSITLRKRPVAIIVIESVSVLPSEIVEGDVAEIYVKVRNDGDVETTGEAEFKVDNTTIGTKTVVLPIGSTRNVTMEWDTVDMEGDHNITLVIGKESMRVPVSVGHRPKAEMKVLRVWLSEDEPLEGTTVKIRAEVVNEGDALAEDVVLVFKDNVRFIAKTKARTYAPGETRKVEIDWKARKGDRLIRVEVEGYPEAGNFEKVKVLDMQSRSCGYSAVIICSALVIGGVGLVRWKKGKGGGPGRTIGYRGG